MRFGSRMPPASATESGVSFAEMMAATTAEIVRELIDAHKKRKDVNLNKLKTKIGMCFQQVLKKLETNCGTSVTNFIPISLPGSSINNF